MPTCPLRVLVVDGNETFLEILARFLQENHGGALGAEPRAFEARLRERLDQKY